MIGHVIAWVALGFLFACGLLSLLGILGGPLDDPPRHSHNTPPLGDSLIGEGDEP